MTAARSYRFAARDHSGWLLGLQAGQCVILGVGVFTGGILLNLGAPVPVLIAVVACSMLAAFVPLGGRAGYEWVPVAFGWLLHRGRPWTATPPRLDTTGAPMSAAPQWPRFLDGISFADHDGWRSGSTMTVISDRHAGTATGVLRVSGREFALIDRSEQERLLGGWGDALAGFCQERSPVVAVRWFEWSAPADPSAHVQWCRDHQGDAADPDLVERYVAAVRAAGPMSSRHEVLVTVTVGAGHSGRVGFGGGRRDRAGVDNLRDELRLLANRLDATGLSVSPPVDTAQLVRVLRDRCDPYGGAPGRDPATLAELAGLVRVTNAAPMATDVEWSRLHVDGALHATYAVLEWPRLEVAANWMEPLLLHAGGIRTVAMHMEPVRPSTSHRRVERDATKLTVDAEQRQRSGFRIGARHRRAERDVAAREAELVAGYCELEYCGLVTVTAEHVDGLERSCAEWEQIAAQTGVVLRRLYGQQDTAFACSLPVGIGPSRRGWE